MPAAHSQSTHAAHGDLALRQIDPRNRRHGRARRILWVHGYTLSSLIWDELWSLMPDHHHIAVDLPGHGRARALTASDTTRELAEHVLSAARATGATDLVGLSFGGTICLEAAIQAPDLFEHVFLAAPGLVGGPEDPESASCNQELMAMTRERGVGPWLTDRWMATPPGIFSGIDRHSPLWRLLREVILAHRWEVLGTPIMAGLFVHEQSPRKIARIRSQIHLITGECDMQSFLRCSELIRRASRSASRHTITGGHHLCLLTKAREGAAMINECLQANA